MTSNSTHSLSHSFCEPGVWARLSRALYLGSREAAIEVSTRAGYSSGGSTGKKLASPHVWLLVPFCPSPFSVQGFLLALRQSCSQRLEVICISLACGIPQLAHLHLQAMKDNVYSKPANRQSLHNVTSSQTCHPTSLAVCHWLEASQVLPRPKGVDLEVSKPGERITQGHPSVCVSGLASQHTSSPL